MAIPSYALSFTLLRLWYRHRYRFRFWRYRLRCYRRLGLRYYHRFGLWYRHRYRFWFYRPRQRFHFWFTGVISLMPTVSVTIIMVIEILVLSHSRMPLRPAAIIVTFLIIVYTGSCRRSWVWSRRRWRYTACQVQRDKQSRTKCH